VQPLRLVLEQGIQKPQEQLIMTNLKKLLMELGNELVINYGADPHTDSRCAAIQKLMDELNVWGGVGVEDNDEAMRGQLELVDASTKLGFLWPVVEKPRPT
jgi:hypothetical protein